MVVLLEIVLAVLRKADMWGRVCSEGKLNGVYTLIQFDQTVDHSCFHNF